jgi:hypothetical protein
MLRRMNSAWIAVMGTILGGVLAASTALISQTLQAKRERQAKLADARRLAYVEYVQAAHTLLEAADFAIDEKARKDGGAARYIQDELRAFHTARHAVSLLGAEATRSATIELSAAFGNYFQAIDDRPKTERDEARLAVVNVRRELLQAMRRELGVDEGVT